MSQITKSQVESELHRLAEFIEAQPNQFPTIDNSKEAWPNISFSSNSTVYYEAHGWGEKVFSFPAFDLEHLMFMVFKDITFLMATEYERRNRNSNEDFRRQLFSKQIELMRTLDAEWASRTQREIEEILRAVPSDDRLPAK